MLSLLLISETQVKKCKRYIPCPGPSYEQQLKTQKGNFAKYIARIKPRSLHYNINKASLARPFLRFAVASKFTVKPVTMTVVLASPQFNYSNIFLSFFYCCLLPSSCQLLYLPSLTDALKPRSPPPQIEHCRQEPTLDNRPVKQL